MSNATESSISVGWEVAGQYIILVGKGYNPVEKSQAKLNEVLELLRQKKVNKLLIDVSEAAPYGKALEDWLNQVWEPQAIAAGLKFQAIILPKNAFTKSIVESAMHKKQTTALQRGFFDSLAGAKQWLSSQ